MMKKRGSSQIDWVVSLALFLLYLAWFFIIIRPSIQPSYSQEDLFTIMKSNIMKELSSSIDITPVFVTSNMTKEDFPAYIEKPAYLGEDNFAFQDRRQHTVLGNRIFFFQDLRKKKEIAYIAKGEEEYEKPFVISHVNTSESHASAAQTRAFYDEAELKGAEYNGRLSFDEFELLRGTEALSGNSTSSSSAMLAARMLKTDYLTFSTILFDRNNMIMAIADFDENAEPFNLTMSMRLYNYGNYFATSNDNGEIDYEGPCMDFESDTIHFYSGGSSASFLMQNKSEISICASKENETGIIGMEIKMPYSKSIVSYILFGNSTRFEDSMMINLTQKGMPKAKIGMVEKVNGFTRARMDKFSEKEYYTLKRSWGYPDASELDITIKQNTTLLMELSREKPGNEINIFTSYMPCTVVDKYGNIGQCTLLMRSWQ